MNYTHITVAGCGVLGSQIAFQTAFNDFRVSVYDISDEAIAQGKERIKKLQERYKEDLNATDEQLDDALQRISFHTDLSEATKEADLLIEAVPELIEIKKEFYQELSQVAPEETVFASNSSTMIPSQLVSFVDRPEKFLMLHFANEIWLNNTAEVMKHGATNMDVFNDLIKFAEAINMIPLPIYKEQPGYILNSLLVPYLDAAQYLLVNEIADVETIDKTWMAATGSPRGPFATLDVIGIRTPYNLAVAKAEKGDEHKKKVANYLKENYLDKGKLGIESGEGFYTYPNPRFKEVDFLT
ncbi:MAG TPA: 3-hydroxyacyl-CoA dehydrogenase [Pseudogracilibacillus sp.]|nr:3-hydroxyacyl-CoA dehydrogenase [Pseudogracilibacillus sp.]